MAILLKSNAVFLHIPKTGGSWVRKVLYDNDLVVCSFSHEHADLERVLNLSGHYPGDFIKKSLKIRSNIERKVRNAYKFAFIRHPVSWYVSTWRYMESIQWHDFVKKQNPSRFHLKYDHWHPFEKLYPLKSANLSEFIHNVITKIPGYYTNLVYSYTGMDTLDFIGRQEHLLEDLKKVLTNLGIETAELHFEPEKVNRSIIPKPELDSQLAEMILQSEYPVIKKYYT
jgi:hypothetical protein